MEQGYPNPLEEAQLTQCDSCDNIVLEHGEMKVAIQNQHDLARPRLLDKMPLAQHLPAGSGAEGHMTPRSEKANLKLNTLRIYWGTWICLHPVIPYFP